MCQIVPENVFSRTTRAVRLTSRDHPSSNVTMEFSINSRPEKRLLFKSKVCYVECSRISQGVVPVMELPSTKNSFHLLFSSMTLELNPSVDWNRHGNVLSWPGFRCFLVADQSRRWHPNTHPQCHARQCILRPTRLRHR
jgi:hypothetical protein